ncbi:MAG: M20/M25/M40 family metallo-hydrolase [Omnitrophica WOR_2 bacterium]
MDISQINRILNLAIAIQQIPAPTFSERQRANFVFQCFQKELLSDVQIDLLGNVYGCLPGAGSGKPLVVTAHTDTVFPASTDLKIRRDSENVSGPGIGDNSLGVAGLFGLVWALRQKSLSQKQSALSGDLWLVANVGEEGLGNLRGMKAVVERFGKEARAYLVLEGMSLGQIYHRGLAVKRYRIAVNTPGGHSWVDHGRPSAIHVLAQLVTRITSLPHPGNPRTTLNVGVIQGGTSVNTIAAQASLELDLRSESVQELEALVNQVERLVRETNQKDVRATAEMIGWRPAGGIASDHPLVKLAAQILMMQGLKPRFNIGSTDANIPLSLGLPCICLGLTSGSGAHTTEEQIHTMPISQGMEQIVQVVERVYASL